MNSIPASEFVNVVPGVLGAGGNSLSVNAVFVDNSDDTSIPIGTTQAFSSLTAVQDWYGANSIQAKLAGYYFSGYINGPTLPGTLYFTQYNAAAVSGYLRGGSIASLTLTELQGLSGVLTIVIDGMTVTSSSISLSGDSSPTAAASTIESGLQTVGGIFSGTGTLVSGSPTLTIASTVSGQLYVGAPLTGTDIPSGATVLSFGSYTPAMGTGTVTMSANATATVSSPETIDSTSDATVTYDTLREAFVITSGTTGANSSVAFPTTDSFATGLMLTQATGAVLSPGAAAATPAGTMDGVVNNTQNWVTFLTVDEPILSVKLAFAAWVQTTAQRYAYVCFDSDVTPTESTAATGSFGYEVNAAADFGIFPVWEPTTISGSAQVQGAVAAFACGVAASINFNQTNGNTTWAYRSQAGLVPAVTNLQVYTNLKANGYNAYVAVATANQNFQFLQPGQISGDWLWMQPYINQIYFNSQLQLALMELETSVGAIPYNRAGYTLIRQACMTVINQMLNFGAIQPGVQLSASQIQEVNTAAGINIASTLQTAGWFLQITPATPQQRSARTSPPITLWYVDGGSIQQISLNSIDVE